MKLHVCERSNSGRVLAPLLEADHDIYWRYIYIHYLYMLLLTASMK